MGQLQIVSHPLATDKISKLRNKNLSPHDFRRLLQEISIILAIEATAQCPLKEVDVETPLEKTTGQMLAKEIVLVPILRAGLGMLNGFLNIIPNAKIGYLGVYRNEATLEPVTYYANLPTDIDRSEIFLLDPMLATGGSANFCLSVIKNRGGKSITMVSLVSAPEGVAAVQQNHPEVKMITASLDRELNEKGYILPGLGDAGDRFNETEK
ncbi:uracil phosphoribosyltransferase [candidate division KSB1 bacterium]|nr:uracil phosphoribosyltransferase [candidate division KSB1 bacterium]